MGDRCNMTLMYQAKDAETIGKAIDERMDPVGAALDANPGWCEEEFEDVNYGAYNAREQLASQGFVFLGSHGSGHEYDAHDFVAIDGHSYDALRGACGNLYVACDDNGNPSMTSVNELKCYLEAYRRIMDEIEHPSEAPSIKRGGLI